VNGIHEVVGSIPFASNKEMSDHNKSGQLDPEIASLMGITPDQQASPEFTDLFTEEKAADQASAEDVDLSRKQFSPITKSEEKAKPFFRNKKYYQVLLSGEGERAKKVHALLSQFAAAGDPAEKSLYRGRLIPAFWDLAAGIAARTGTEMPFPKILLLRFGILSPTLISAQQRDMISRIIWKNDTSEPVHYFDEWLLKIAQGTVNPSATDEVKQVKLDMNQKLKGKVEKRKGQRQAELGLLQSKIVQLDEIENSLKNQVACILQHQKRSEYGNLKDAFTAEQREAIAQIAIIMRQLSNIDREIRNCYGHLEEMDRELDNLTEKAEGSQEAVFVDRGTVIKEFNSLRQMTKMCVGRQGNHFPILMKSYIRSSLGEIATRENVINIMARVERLDPGLFERTFKGQTNRIVPHTLLLPNYGELGICWEPFERFNRATSRGRIAIPLYPKDLQTVVIAALADLRWQVAKEKAQHYWMEEGITGRYYMAFQDKKLRGDVREYFIRDYILWITKESQGTQKLERDVRGIFWRQIPFPQDVKDNLKNRGYVYNELYKKDVNISMSDGY
jgi:hypothetical protein